MIHRLKKFFLRPSDTSGYVYYAKFIKAGCFFYVIGLSREKSFKENIIKNEYDESVDKVFLYKYREDGWDVVQDILHLLKKKTKSAQYCQDSSFQLYGEGQSTHFSYDVLGLDRERYMLSKEAEESQKESGFGCLFVLIGLVLIPFTAGISIALVLIFIGIIAICDHSVRHGKEISEKVPPTLPPKLRSLVNSLIV